MSRFHGTVALVLTVLAAGFSLSVYHLLPDQIPTHWNLAGEVDAYGSKQWAAFLTPAIMLAMLGLFRSLPWLSPKNFEIESFRQTYGFIVVLVMGLLAYIHVLVLLPGLGYELRVDRVLMAGMMLFFIFLGNVLGKVQRNFFVGVRTPWTLASERVWTETHRFAAWVFVGTGLLGLAAILAGISPLVPLVLVMVCALSTVLFSLVRYKSLERRGQL